MWGTSELFKHREDLSSTMDFRWRRIEMLEGSFNHIVLDSSSMCHMCPWDADVRSSSFEHVLRLPKVLAPEGLLKAICKSPREPNFNAGW